MSRPIHKTYGAGYVTLCEKDASRVPTDTDWAKITCKRCLRFKPEAANA